jgi:hypothetical protein
VLRQHSKRLNDAQESRIARAPQTGNPRYLVTLLDDIAAWGTFETLDKRIDTDLAARDTAQLYVFMFRSRCLLLLLSLISCDLDMSCCWLVLKTIMVPTLCARTSHSSGALTTVNRSWVVFVRIQTFDVLGLHVDDELTPLLAADVSDQHRYISTRLTTHQQKKGSSTTGLVACCSRSRRTITKHWWIGTIFAVDFAQTFTVFFFFCC